MFPESLSLALRATADWSRVFHVIQVIGSQFNHRQRRFLKALLVEHAIAELSNGTITYSGEDPDAPDHVFDGVRLETKFQSGALLNTNGTYHTNNRVRNIKLHNFIGDSEHKRSLPDKFDYLMIVDTLAVAVCPYHVVQLHMEYKSDGIYTRDLPYAAVAWVVPPQTYMCVDPSAKLPDGLMDELVRRVLAQANAMTCSIGPAVDNTPSLWLE